VKYARYRANESSYPIKLFYTGNTPVILQTCFLSNLYVASQMIHKLYPSNVLLKLLGTWETDELTHTVKPTGGLIYYLSPPLSLWELLSDPFRALFYLTFVLTLCAIFAKTWIYVANTSSASVASQLKEKGMVVPGYRDTAMKDMLNRYIPPSAILGGMVIGLLTVGADFMGAIGSGTGILMGVTIIYNYYEIFTREQFGDMAAAMG